MDIIQNSDNPVSLAYTTSNEDRNVNGMVHGGVIYYLCDEAVGRQVTQMGKVGAAADGSIHYYRPVRLGERITVTVFERKIGRRLGVFAVEARNDPGKLIADALFTIAFVE